MKKKVCLLAAGVIMVMMAIGQLVSPAPASKGGAEKYVTADTLAIKKAGESFLKAYLAGDAKGVAAHWTENGEYLADDGTTFRGRADIEKEYKRLFDDKKGPVDASIDVTSIRFPSKDTAIEEGYFKVRLGKDAPIATRYSVLYVREGDQWLMALVREWPTEGVSIRDLDWLAGSWEAKRADTVICTTYEWWGDKTFLRGHIEIVHKGKTIHGTQMIGKDHKTRQIRSWTFDPDGSFAEAMWSRDGNKWMQESAAVLEDGRVLVQTNIFTRIDDDTFTFQSVERSMDGVALADIPPTRVTRVKSKAK